VGRNSQDVNVCTRTKTESDAGDGFSANDLVEL
jgi:DNA repair exonuclease SbcCD ATPase subunit